MTLNDNMIPSKEATRYLGILLDKKLTWATHIKTKIKSLNLKLHKLRHILKSNLPLNTKLLIYKQIIRPSLTYAIQLRPKFLIWNFFNNSSQFAFALFQKPLGTLPIFPSTLTSKSQSFTHLPPTIINLSTKTLTITQIL